MIPEKISQLSIVLHSCYRVTCKPMPTLI